MSRSKRKPTASKRKTETKALAGDTPRQRELTGKANPTAAFEAISDLEHNLTSIEHMAAALHIIACSVEEGGDKLVSNALCGVAYALNHHLKHAWEKRSIAWEATWAYAHGVAS